MNTLTAPKKKCLGNCEMCLGTEEIILDWNDGRGEHKQIVQPCECTLGA